MGRIKSGSILVELPLLNYPALIKLVEHLVERGIKTIDILLESTVIDTELALSTIPVAVTPFSIVIENLDLEATSKVCQNICRFYVVVRDAWAESARVSTELMLGFLRTLAAETGFYNVLENVRIALVSGPACTAPIIIETLAVKYPVATHAEYTVSQLSEVILKAIKDVRGIPLAFCISNGVHLMALLEVSEAGRTLYIKKPISDLEYSTCVQVMLDFLVYMSLKELDHKKGRQ